MPRFYHADSFACDQELFLEDAEARHALTVLRMHTGDQLTLLDGCGAVAEASIIHTDKRQVKVKVNNITQHPVITPSLTVASAIPKGDRCDEMIDMLAQLGASRWIPLLTERSSVIPRDNKLQKWQRRVREAAKQAITPHFMQIDAPVCLSDLFTKHGESNYLIADPRGTTIIADAKSPLTPTCVLIGPEGGWTDNELSLCADAGCKAWRFAPYILRIETAAIAACAILRQSAPSQNCCHE